MGLSRRQREEPGKLVYFHRTTAPKGYTAADGTTLAVASVRPSFLAAIYCGDANNATAAWGYRCTAANGTGRSTTGAYIVKPDHRGEWARGWDNGRGVDAGRSLYTWQEGQMPAHNHGTAVGSSEGDDPGTVTNGGGANSVDVLSRTVGGTSNGSENRVRGLAALACLTL